MLIFAKNFFIMKMQRFNYKKLVNILLFDYFQVEKRHREGRNYLKVITKIVETLHLVVPFFVGKCEEKSQT